MVEDKFPEDVVRIREEVSPKFEVTAYTLELEKRKKFPLQIFENIEGYKIPVVQNVLATRERIAMALETSVEKLTETWLQKEKELTPVKEVSDGPIKEVISKGDKVDLTKLPILTHFPQDAGPYVTAGTIVAKDPDTGVTNASFHRLQLKERDKFGVSLHTRRHLWDYQRRAEERGKPLQIAIVNGVHPTFELGSVWMGPISGNHYEVIGGFMGEPLEVVKCETNDVFVPANAEIVLEGEILPNIREREGPFGEFTGYRSRRSTNHVVKVNCITHRAEPIYQSICAGFAAEHSLLGAVPREPNVYRAVSAHVPTVKSVCYPMSGTCRFHCYISLKKTVEGQPKNAIFAAFAADHYVKLVVVVDEDISVYNETEVLWAMATRMQADEDVFIIPRVMSSLLDPSTKAGMSAKVGMDATIPLEGWEAETIKVPEEVINKVKSKYGLK